MFRSRSFNLGTETREALTYFMAEAAKDAELLPEGPTLIRKALRELIDAGCIGGDLPDLLPPSSVPDLSLEQIKVKRYAVEQFLYEAREAAARISLEGGPAIFIVEDLIAALWEDGTLRENSCPRSDAITLYGAFAGLPISETPIEFRDDPYYRRRD